MAKPKRNTNAIQSSWAVNVTARVYSYADGVVLRKQGRHGTRRDGGG